MSTQTTNEMILWLEGRMGRTFEAWERKTLIQWLRRICFEFTL